MKNKQHGPYRLPTVTLDNGKTYFVDMRLKQLRNVKTPMITLTSKVRLYLP